MDQLLEYRSLRFLYVMQSTLQTRVVLQRHSLGLLRYVEFSIMFNNNGYFDKKILVVTHHIESFSFILQAPEGCSTLTFPINMGWKSTMDILAFDGVITAREAKVHAK